MGTSRERGPDPAAFDGEPTATELWARAEAVLEHAKNGLVASLPSGPGFGAGARWMDRALRVVRRERGAGASRWDEAPRAFAVLSWMLGLGKYGGALLAGLLLADVAVTWSANAGHPLELWQRTLVFVGVVPLVFYFVEVWLVFAFPAALDGEQPVSESARLVARRGARRNLPILLAIARRMAFVPPARLRRAWATGCVAVVVWYEHERRRAGRAKAKA